MRKPVVAGNWKMNLLIDDAVELVNELKPRIEANDNVQVIVCPVFTALAPVAEALSGSAIAMGAQNCYSKESGAYTGEVSPRMLMDAGCTWTIVGHSERRQYFNESDEFLNEKLCFALASGLNAIFCIGESLEERQTGKMKDVLSRQVSLGLQNLDRGSFDRVVMAYEPVWAIGTGLNATPEQAQEAHAFVRGLIANQYDETIAKAMRIQYGGSVKPDNAEGLMSQPDVDGALVGGASLNAQSFAAIVKSAAGKN